MIWCGWCCHSDLGEEGIGADGAGMLAGVLGQCSSLTVLDLSGNDIGDEGAGRLAGVLGQCSLLGQCSSLEKLFFGCRAGSFRQWHRCGLGRDAGWGAGAVLLTRRAGSFRQ